jgi:histidinol dehydrogenase
MKVYKYPSREHWPEIIQRPVTENASLQKTVIAILNNVKEGGDKAVLRYTHQFDGAKIEDMRVTDNELQNARSSVSNQLKKAIQQAKKNIETFHLSQKEEIRKIETMPGVICWRQSLGIEKVGLYIPGGSASLFSTVLMLGIPARIAGCKEIILCTPPGKDGSVCPAVLYTTQLCGITRIFKAGGVQAIAAMAYGTETIPKVFKIFGPGNQYVTSAKQIIQQEGVAIDMPAGPSELLVIADETAIPGFVASDLLSQAEHGNDSQVLLVTTSDQIIREVEMELEKQVEQLPRKKIAKQVLKNSKLILVRNIEEAVSLSNLYAPEHLILSCDNAEYVSKLVTAAGSVFLGNYSPESAGDYASGTNHTLPTNGYATVYSGVSLDSFVKKITYQQLTKEGLQNISDTVMTMAETEGLDAHKNAVAIRLKK